LKTLLDSPTRKTGRELKNNWFSCSLESQFRSTTVSISQTEELDGLKSPAKQNSTKLGSPFDVSVSFGTSQSVTNSKDSFSNPKKWKPLGDFRVALPMISTIF
jgi:hypothetical protein